MSIYNILWGTNKKVTGVVAIYQRKPGVYGRAGENNSSSRTHEQKIPTE